MAGEAVIPMKFVATGDISSAQAALAKLEAENEKLKGSYRGVQVQLEKLQATQSRRVDPMASAMSKGSTGIDTISAGMSKAAAESKRAADHEAAKAAYMARGAETARKLREMDAARQSFNPFRGAMANQAADNALRERHRAELAALPPMIPGPMGRLALSEQVASKKKTADIIAQVRGELTAKNASIAAEAKLAELQSQRVGIGQHLVNTGATALGSMAATVGAAVSLHTVMTNLVGLNKEWSDGLSKIDDQLELASVRLAIQTGQGGPELKKSIDVAIGSIKDMPAITSLPEAVQMQTFLASSTMNKSDVASGAGMKSVLKTLVAINAFGEGGEMDPKEATRLLTGATLGFGLDSSAASVERIGSVLAAAFKETQMTGAQTKDLLRIAPSLQQFGVSPEDATAAFSRMVSQNIESPHAAVGIRNFLAKLSDVKPDQERDRALQSVGLTQSDIAVRKGGPTLFDSLTRISGALEGKDELTKNQFLSQVFGAENLESVSAMLQDRQSMSDLSKKLGDRATFDEAVATFQSSDYARKQGVSISEEMAKRQAVEAAGGVTWDEVRKARSAAFAQERADAEARGESSFGIGLRQLDERARMFMSESVFGESPKTFASNPFQYDTELKQTMKELLQTSRQTAENTKTTQQVQRNAQVESWSVNDGGAF